jgi:hypothetical protein
LFDLADAKRHFFADLIILYDVASWIEINLKNNIFSKIKLFLSLDVDSNINQNNY